MKVYQSSASLFSGLFLLSAGVSSTSTASQYPSEAPTSEQNACADTTHDDILAMLDSTETICGPGTRSYMGLAPFIECDTIISYDYDGTISYRGTIYYYVDDPTVDSPKPSAIKVQIWDSDAEKKGHRERLDFKNGKYQNTEGTVFYDGCLDDMKYLWNIEEQMWNVFWTSSPTDSQYPSEAPVMDNDILFHDTAFLNVHYREPEEQQFQVQQIEPTPVDSCANDPEFKVMSPRDMEKGCSWIGRRPIDRCEEPGAMEGCPAVCNSACVDSNSSYCETDPDYTWRNQDCNSFDPTNPMKLCSKRGASRACAACKPACNGDNSNNNNNNNNAVPSPSPIESSQHPSISSTANSTIFI